MAAWIKMSLGMELGLGLGDFVLDRDPAAPSSKRGAEPLPIFGPCLLWSNCWMDEAGAWHGGRPQPRQLCVRWGPIPPPPVTVIYCFIIAKTAEYFNSERSLNNI